MAELRLTIRFDVDRGAQVARVLRDVRATAHDGKIDAYRNRDDALSDIYEGLQKTVESALAGVEALLDIPSEQPA